MSAENIARLGETPVAIAETHSGIQKSWFMSDSSAAGASYGLIGALTTAVIDAIVNAGPSRRAQRAADEVAKAVPADMLTASLRDAFTEAGESVDGASGVTIGEAATRQMILYKDDPADAILVDVAYVLSEDAAALRVRATASYSNPDLKYVSPYAFKKSVPKSELTGPIYRNTFTYESAPFPLPALTDDLKARMIASINESYTGPNGKLPVAGDDDYKAMQKELEQAGDDELSKSEASFFLVREWLKDDAVPLKAEIESAHAFIARYVMIDINAVDVPSMEGTDRLIDKAESGRVVRMIGSGTESGSYVSTSGATGVFPTYGNATRIAEVHEEKISKLKVQAKSAPK
ncbi:MAG: hypothetical protein ACK4P2_06410 [Hyphomonas sp.]